MTPYDEAEVTARAAMAVPCAEIHPAGAECAFCNPVTVGEFSASPAYLAERLAVAHARRRR